MAEGEPIDQQKEQKFPFAVVRESLPTAGSSVYAEDQAEEGEVEGDGGESDEERDPNDIVQTTLLTTTATATTTVAYDADDFSDYGDDDDD